MYQNLQLRLLKKSRHLAWGQSLPGSKISASCLSYFHLLFLFLFLSYLAYEFINSASYIRIVCIMIVPGICLQHTRTFTKWSPFPLLRFVDPQALGVRSLRV